MLPMENSCHVFLQKHSVPKDLGNNYAVKKKKIKIEVTYIFNDLFFEALEYHSVSNTAHLFLFPFLLTNMQNIRAHYHPVNSWNPLEKPVLTLISCW